MKKIVLRKTTAKLPVKQNKINEADPNTKIPKSRHK